MQGISNLHVPHALRRIFSYVNSTNSCGYTANQAHDCLQISAMVFNMNNFKLQIEEIKCSVQSLVPTLVVISKSGSSVATSSSTFQPPSIVDIVPKSVLIKEVRNAIIKSLNPKLSNDNDGTSVIISGLMESKDDFA